MLRYAEKAGVQRLGRMNHRHDYAGLVHHETNATTRDGCGVLAQSSPTCRLATKRKPRLFAVGGRTGNLPEEITGFDAISIPA